MLDKLFQFPDTTKLNKIIAKNKIFEQKNITTKIKTLFQSDLEKIIWANKISPQTIKLPSQGEIEEFQIFRLILRNKDVSTKVLETIDRLIPSPIIFMLQYRFETSYKAAYKRRSESDHKKWVLTEYFSSKWISDEEKKQDLPIHLNLEALYHHFLHFLILHKIKKNERFKEFINRVSELKKLENEMKILESKIKNTKQFNRKADINHTLQQVKKKHLSLL